MIDSLAVTLPFQVAGAILFAATSGFIQSGGVSTTCWKIEKVPDGLAPPPPVNSNFGKRCTGSILGHVTENYFKIGRVTQTDTTTITVFQTYMLNRDNEPINGWSIDWIAAAAFVGYFVFLGTRGGTLGDGLMSTRIVDTAVPEADRVPLRKVVVRYLAMPIGFVPMIAFFLVWLFGYGADAGAIDASGIFRWFPLAAIPAFGWMIWIVVQMARKHDPIYDQIAGTAVIKN